MTRRALTMLELLTVIVIMGILISLLLPALQACRESARRARCTNNLTQLMVAIHHYEHANRVYPAGVINPKGPIEYRPVGYHHNWIAQTLPFMEETIAYRHIDFQEGVYHKNNSRVHTLHNRRFECPSYAPAIGPFGPISNYAAVHHDVNKPIDADDNGVFFLNSRVRFRDVTDGVGHTIFLGEKFADPYDLGWMSGTHATLRNMGKPIRSIPPESAAWHQRQDAEPYSRFPGEGADDDWDRGRIAGEAKATHDTAFGSHHQGGCQFAFGDGRVEFIHAFVDLQVLQALANRADGTLTAQKYYRNGHP